MPRLAGLAAPFLTVLTGLVLAASPGPEPRSGVWPLDPRPSVVTPFDPPDVPWGSGHRGVDLLGAVGQQVRTSVGGTVRFAGEVAGRGVVSVDHGTFRTTYQPVVATVAVGQSVRAGEAVGFLARRGSHCLPRACLHWGLVEGVATYRDPLLLVGCGVRPVRLLPLHEPVPRSDCGPAGASRTPLTPPVAAALALRVALTLAGAPGGRPLGAGPG